MFNFIQPGEAQLKPVAQRPDEANEIIREAADLKVPEAKKVDADRVDLAAQVALPYVGVAVLATWVGATLDLAHTVESATAVAIGMIVLLVGTALVAAVSAIKPVR